MCKNTWMQPCYESVFVVCVYVASQLTSSYWIANKRTHLWERLILSLQLLVACSSLSILFPLPHSRVYWHCHCPGPVCVGISRMDSFTADFLAFWLILFLPPFPQCPLSHRCRSRDEDVSTSTRAAISSIRWLCRLVVFRDGLYLW